MEEYKAYIESGINYNANKTFFIKQLFAQFIIILLGLFPAIILKSTWLIISLIMVCIYFVGSILTIFVCLKHKNMTIITRLTLQMVLYSEWVIQLLLFQTQYFILGFGLNPLIILIYIPPISIPIILAVINNYKLRKGNYKNYKSNRTSSLLSFGLAGVLGSNFAAFLLKDLKQQVAITVVLICFSLVTNLMSIGLLSIQRLYFVQKNFVKN